MTDGAISVLDGNTFVVSDGQGNIEPTPGEPTGMFSYDTRFLSRWVLTLNGQRLKPLSVDDSQYFQVRFFLVSTETAVYVNANLSVLRQRTMSDGLLEDITINNLQNEAVDATIRIEADTDFADIFDLKDSRQTQGGCVRRVEANQLVLSYERGEFRRETTISTDGPAEIDEHGISFVAHVEAHQTWTVQVRVVPMMIEWGGRRRALRPTMNPSDTPRDLQQDLVEWLERAPRLEECDWDPLKETYRRSLVDLAALRYSPILAGAESVPAAGLPWFMTLFGRDSIITSLQIPGFRPGTGRHHLAGPRAVAGQQGR